MVDGDDIVLKVNVLDGKSTEFGDSHSGMKQDVECLVILTEHIIVPDELEELPHLVFCDGFPCNSVIHHHSGKFKTERVLDEDIIVHRHLECRTKDTTHGLDGTVPPAILLQFNKENSYRRRPHNRLQCLLCGHFRFGAELLVIRYTKRINFDLAEIAI